MPRNEESLHERIKGIEVWREVASKDIQDLKEDSERTQSFINRMYGLATGLSLLGVTVGYKLRRLLGLE